VLIEHARNLARIADAAHAEYGGGGTPVISQLACSLVGETITVELAPGSRLAALHGTATVTERTTCSYGIEPSFEQIASEHGMRVVGTDDGGIPPSSGTTTPSSWAPFTSPSSARRPAHLTPCSWACCAPPCRDGILVAGLV
jgi:hypothetical protein